MRAMGNDWRSPRGRAWAIALTLVALLSLTASVVMAAGHQAPQTAPPQAAAEHHGGEASLILPDLGQAKFLGTDGRTLHDVIGHVRACAWRSGPVVHRSSVAQGGARPRARYAARHRPVSDRPTAALMPHGETTRKVASSAGFHGW